VRFVWRRPQDGEGQHAWFNPGRLATAGKKGQGGFGGLAGARAHFEFLGRTGRWTRPWK
jgi:hypothetical protein